MTGWQAANARVDGADGFTVGPYRAFFYSNERNEPPHIHVRAGGHEAKFWLHDLTVAINAGFSSHEIGDIIRHLGQNRKTLSSA